MDIFFQDPNEVPLPPEEVRILELSADPYPDGRRIRVHIEVTPFLKRPNADVVLLDMDGHEVASVSVIESMNRKMEITLHLRHPNPGEYQLQVVLFYRDPIPEPKGEEPEPPLLPEAQIIDRKEVSFHIAEEKE